MNARQFYSRLLTTLGRYDEGLNEMYKAQELDPRSADLGVPLSGILERRGAFDEAIRVLESTLEMDKDSNFARRGIANAYLLKGDYAKVVELGRDRIAVSQLPQTSPGLPCWPPPITERANWIRRG